MKKKTFWTIMGIALAVLVAIVIWQTIALNSLSTTTAAATKAATTTASSSSYGAMVGGC